MEQTEIGDSQYYTAMAHFYRGELGRAMIWRQRLDATTNWAIASATAVISLGLSHPEIPHLVFMLANLIVLLLLIIEARRYRYYDAFRARVRMLEAHFLMPVVMRDARLLQGDWRKTLAGDLVLPSYKIGYREAIGRRLVRNYVWIFILIAGAWVLKIYLHHGPVASLPALPGRMQASQPLSPALFWAILAVFYLPLAYLGAYAVLVRQASGEFHRRPLEGKKWIM